MLTVHIRVNDEATGRPTPVRLGVTGPDGTYYAPFGRVAEFAAERMDTVLAEHQALDWDAPVCGAMSA